MFINRTHLENFFDLLISVRKTKYIEICDNFNVLEIEEIFNGLINEKSFKTPNKVLLTTIFRASPSHGAIFFLNIDTYIYNVKAGCDKNSHTQRYNFWCDFIHWALETTSEIHKTDKFFWPINKDNLKYHHFQPLGFFEFFFKSLVSYYDFIFCPVTSCIYKLNHNSRNDMRSLPQ